MSMNDGDFDPKEYIVTYKGGSGFGLSVLLFCIFIAAYCLAKASGY